jgi:hypothetical protein
MVTDYGLDDRGLYSGQVSFPWGYSGRVLKLIIYLNLVPTSRKVDVILHSVMSSCRGA